MSSTHTSENHESFLYTLMDGSDPVQALAESANRDCEECQVQLEHLLALRNQLDFAGAEERQVLEAAKTTPDGLPDDHVAQALAELQPHGRNRRSHAGWMGTLLAIAVALVLYLQLRPPTNTDPMNDLTIMGTEGEVLSASELGVEWKPAASSSATYVVKLYDAKNDGQPMYTSTIIRGKCSHYPEPGKISWGTTSDFYWEIEVSSQRVNSPERFIRSEQLAR